MAIPRIVIAGVNFPELNQTLIKEHDDGKVNLIGFVDDRFSELPEEIYDFPIIGTWDNIKNLDCDVINSVAVNCRARKRADVRLLNLGANIIGTCASPLPKVSSQLEISPTAVILEDVRIGLNCKIGGNSVVHQGTHIGHDVEIHEYCFIGPNVTLLGGVSIESYSYIGAGAIIGNGITIGRGSTISSGAVVFSSVTPNSLIAGNPAIKLGENEEL